MREQPNPGSDEAIDKGCTCAVLDNAHGKGCGWKDEQGKPLFWISGDCPLHASKPQPEKRGKG